MPSAFNLLDSESAVCSMEMTELLPMLEQVTGQERYT
jgi:hypothetical protein